MSVHRAAVIGAGPAGFYAADQLLEAGFEVDLYDALPTPFGLVRAGRGARPPEDQVGHARLREDRGARRASASSAASSSARTSRATSCSSATTRSSTRSAPATTTGSGSPARTGPARTRPPSSSPGTTATPTYADHEFDLSGARAVVDRQRQRGDRRRAHARARPRRAARRPTPPTTRSTRFGARAVDEVVLLGRRGPAQAAFTNPELRELGELARADVIVDPAAARAEAAERPRTPTAAAQRRDPARLRRSASRRASRTGSSCASCARRSRSSARARTARSTGVRVVRNRLDETAARVADRRGGDHRVRPRAALDRLPRRARSPGVPFDERRGLIANEGGRVTGAAASARRVRVGWIKRGPSGVIGTNKKDAADTVARMVEDEQAGTLGTPADARRGRDRRLARRARARRGHVGGLAGDRRARDGRRRAPGPPAREARDAGRAARGRPPRARSR